MADETYHAVIGILTHGEKVLLVERPLDANNFAGMIGFPGTKVRPGETDRWAIRSVFQVEAGVDIEIVEKLGTVEQYIHSMLGDTEVILSVFEVSELETMHLAEDTFWARGDRLEEMEVVPGNIDIFEQLYQQRRGGRYRSEVREGMFSGYHQLSFEWLGPEGAR